MPAQESPSDAACEICGNRRGNRVHLAREMMFGTGEAFRYLECGACGCLQLLDVSPDPARHYPAGYYAYARDGRMKAALRRARARFAAGRFDPLGALATLVFGLDYAARSIAAAGIGRSETILDVGCGSGQLLCSMADLGYAHLSGVDPFIAADIVHESGVRIRKAQLGDIEGPFDVVMFNHSFEHMADPAVVLRQAARLLAPRGRVIVRIPVAGSEAWRRFGTNWMHLDAPRHLYIHSRASLELLARRAGLRIGTLAYEGNASQFVGSLQIEKGIALAGPGSVYAGGWRRWAAWTRTWIYEARAARLNREQRGDWARFELRPAAAGSSTSGTSGISRPDV